MLSRVAETIYWIGRFHERAENTARLVKVNTNLTLDLPRNVMPHWEPLITILGGEELYNERHPEWTERRIVNFIISDESNPTSILSSLAYARENARTIRDILPREGWEAVNAAYLNAVEQKSESYSRARRQEYLNEIMDDLQHITGLLAGTMNHDMAYDFLNLGRKIERADMTTRIIDVRSDYTVPEDMPELRPFEDMIWMSILKSLSAYQMYRQSMQVRIRRNDVLKFLFCDNLFPRSVAYCVHNIEDNLSRMPRNNNCRKHLNKLHDLLDKPMEKEMDNKTLHEYIDTLQLQLAQLHHDLSLSYFPSLSDQVQSQSQ
jgi:uncharacterized alpha-E superfamily protein